jgi:hypothetical protein
LNRKNYLKFAQKTEQKQLKSYSLKNFREKAIFLLRLAAHSPPAPCAAIYIGRSLRGPAQWRPVACQHAPLKISGRRIRSDG